MISRRQCHLQMPACLDSFRGLFPLQQISDELALIRRRPFATAEWVQKYKTVPDEHRAKDLREVLECESELDTVLLRSVASAVIEDDCGKRTATGGPPQKALQSKATAQDLNSLLLWQFSDLRDSCAGHRQRGGAQEQSSHHYGT
jgi:hypothetical protein